MAQFNFGLRLVSGDGIHKDLTRAALWFEKAAATGHAGSQYMLAMCYLSIDGSLAHSSGEIERLLLLAAKQDHVDAMYELGLLFRGDYKLGISKTALRLRGLVGDRIDPSVRLLERTAGDLEKSKKWFNQGAAAGHPPCLYESGVLCQEDGNVDEA